MTQSSDLEPVNVGRSAELYRWSGTAASVAFATVGFIGTGQIDRANQPPPDTPPTLLAGAASLLASGVRESVSGSPTAALSALVQAASLLEPAGRAVLLPDSPAALAALVALHSGELAIGESVLDRAVAVDQGSQLMFRRHRLLQAWILMLRGRTAAAAECRAAAIVKGTTVEPRDLLYAAALEAGIARRNSDLPGLHRSWNRAFEAVLRHPVDLFTLLPVGELAVAAARLGERDRLGPQLRQAYQLLDRLGNPALWTANLHWCGVHSAILSEQPAEADHHVAALAATAEHSRYGAILATAAQIWVEVLRGTVDPPAVESAARGLHGAGLWWDAARLAGQAAIRTADRRAMTRLLECARVLQGRPMSPGSRAAGATGGVAASGGHARSGRTAGAGAGGEQAPSAGDGAAGGQLAGPAAVPVAGRLSAREQEVAVLLLDGLTYKQIGDRLFISAKTVEHHVARMRQRLDCPSRTDLLARLRAMTDQPGEELIRRPPWPRRPAE